MKKTIWLVVGIAGMCLGNPHTEAHAEVGIRMGDVRVGVGDRPHFVIDRRPSFVYLQDQGFSVSVGSPYDIIYYGDLYYLHRDGSWFHSSHYRGPWDLVRERNLPYKIRRHRWEDLRRYRDVEYRRHDRSYWEDRDRHDRERYDREPRREDNRRDEREQPRDDNRRDGNRPDGRGR